MKNKARVLSENEISLARTVFGDALDYSKVRVREARHGLLKPFQDKGTALTRKNTLYMDGGSYSDDYTQEPLQKQSLFIHELAHVWQHQQKVLNLPVAATKEMLKHKFRYAAAYKYTLDPGRDLKSYGLEQQATIIQEYFLLQNGVSPASGRCQNACPDAEKLDLATKVLKRFLANPGY